MTELETLQRAKRYMDELAQGIDPISGREVHKDSVLNNIRLARCFFYVSGVLQQVIDNGGVSPAPAKRNPRTNEFSITPAQLAKVQPSDESIQISHFINLLMAAVGDPKMKRLNAAVITGWLVEKGFMESVPDANGKAQRLPTDAGRSIGLFMERRTKQDGEYYTVYYRPEAQQFLLDHLFDILDRR